MKRTALTLALTLALGVALGALGATALHAQGGVKRAVLQQQDLAGIPGREAVMVPKPLKVLVTWVAEKGKPLTVPVK